MAVEKHVYGYLLQPAWTHPELTYAIPDVTPLVLLYVHCYFAPRPHDCDRAHTHLRIQPRATHL